MMTQDVIGRNRSANPVGDCGDEQHHVCDGKQEPGRNQSVEDAVHVCCCAGVCFGAMDDERRHALMVIRFAARSLDMCVRETGCVCASLRCVCLRVAGTRAQATQAWFSCTSWPRLAPSTPPNTWYPTLHAHLSHCHLTVTGAGNSDGVLVSRREGGGAAKETEGNYSAHGRDRPRGAHGGPSTGQAQALCPAHHAGESVGTACTALSHYSFQSIA
jgi:hypothetical protein